MGVICCEKKAAFLTSSMVTPIRMDDLLVFSLYDDLMAFRNDEPVWHKNFDGTISEAIHDEEYIYINVIIG